MPRFFVDEKPINGVLSIFGEDARHIARSLRMAVGEKITVCSGGVDYLCELKKISDATVTCEVISEEISREPSVKLTLFQALPKQDKLELIIQKAVELGACEVVPVMTKRCIARPEKGQFDKKLERLQRISLEAAKQSGRGIIPTVSGIIDFDECLRRLKECELALICYEKQGGKRLSELSFEGVKHIGLFIGSEGGFEAQEAEKAVEYGTVPVWLGDRILRCETAPIASIAVIMSLTGNI